MFVKKLETKPVLIIQPPNSRKLKSGYVVLEKGQEIGEHTTTKKEELITVLSGTATVTIENESKKVSAGHIVYIPEEKKHNIKNEEDETLKYIYTVVFLD